MHNMDVFIKLAGIVSGNRLSIIYKIAFVWISTPSQSSHVEQHNEHIRHMKYMHVKKNQPSLVRVLQAYQTFLSFTWNFVNRLKKLFCK